MVEEGGEGIGRGREKEKGGGRDGWWCRVRRIQGREESKEERKLRGSREEVERKRVSMKSKSLTHQLSAPTPPLSPMLHAVTPTQRGRRR